MPGRPALSSGTAAPYRRANRRYNGFTWPPSAIDARLPAQPTAGQVMGTPTLFIDGIVHCGGYDPLTMLAALAP